MIDTTAIEGLAGDSIRSYISEEPIAIIDAMAICIQVFQARMLVCADGYGNLDSHESAHVSCGRLSEVMNSLDQGNRSFYNTREAIIRKLNSVSDIFHVGTPSNATGYDYDSLKRKVNLWKNNITVYEQTHIHDMDDVKDILSNLSKALAAAMNRTAVQSSHYSSGEIPAGDAMRGLANAVLVAAYKTTDEEFQGKLKKAADNYQVRVDEEVAKERREKGVKTVITGIGAVVAGAVCIVATWGAATPLVVAGFVAGGTAIGFGVSESIEGAQDIYYGSIGDLDSVAFNPIRDTVFASNPELYYTIGQISTMASVVIAGGVSIAGVGSSLIAEGATTGQAIRGMAIEAFKMAGSGFAGAGVGKLTYEATGDEVFATITGAGVGIIAGGLANRFIDTKSIVGLSGNKPVVATGIETDNAVLDDSIHSKIPVKGFAEEMAPDDALKYEIWTELRKSGLDIVKQNDLVLTNKGHRPSPAEYLSSEYIDAHLNQFKGGVSKISQKNPSGIAGPPGGTYVMPSEVADKLIQAANGDVATLEKYLGLKSGDLGLNPVRIDVKKPHNLRMPSGNEIGANSEWCPGGVTSGQLPEAVIDSPKPGEYNAYYIFERK